MCLSYFYYPPSSLSSACWNSFNQFFPVSPPILLILLILRVRRSLQFKQSAGACNSSNSCYIGAFYTSSLPFLVPNDQNNTQNQKQFVAIDLEQEYNINDLISIVIYYADDYATHSYQRRGNVGTGLSIYNNNTLLSTKVINRYKSNGTSYGNSPLYDKAQLRFDGSVSAPILSGERNGQDKLSNANSQNKEVWFQNWKTFMGGSTAFRRLMEESVLPMLRRHPLLAHPQDARHRDKYSPVFSLEVLLAIEGNEDDLIHAFKIGKTEYSVMVVTGKSNFVNVRKMTANPFGLCGTDFENFDAAVKHYKNRSIKLELTKIELGL